MWIIVGVIFAGAMQDTVILFCSMRRAGRGCRSGRAGTLGTRSPNSSVRSDRAAPMARVRSGDDR
ncbi:MAG: hypothetical protein JXA67_01335 [Micromonosporaceae bacterium]|nr:hypothetical protein [Micromonosporaceae bacterium]